jgi:hypothetical protein
MKVRYLTALIALPLVVTLTGAEQQLPTEGGGRARGQAPVGERGRGRGPADPFAGQPRINALVVSGGCCHDYALQGRLMMDALSRVLPVDWTLVVQGGRGTRGSMPVYARPDWSKGFDIVIHNECLADLDDPQYIRNITAGHRGGPPAVVIHCAMHSYRAATIDDWREFLGVTSRQHTKPFAIPVKVAAKDHPAMKIQRRLGDADRRALCDRQGVAQHHTGGNRDQPGGQEGISAGVGRRIRGRAGFRDDAGTWQRDLVGSGLS